MLKIIKTGGFLLLSVFMFYCLNQASIHFLAWYLTAQFIRQLFVIFFLGSLLWLVGRGLNHLLIKVAAQQKIDVRMVVVSLSAFWLLDAFLLLRSFHHLDTPFNLFSWVTLLLLLAEITIYPLISIQRQVTYAEHEG